MNLRPLDVLSNVPAGTPGYKKLLQEDFIFLRPVLPFIQYWMNQGQII